MTTFQVNDMTCGHCAGTIRAALAALDPQAAVSIDVTARRVDVESARMGAAQLQDAIQQAGYTPVAVAGSESPGDSPRAGCGCGCGSR